MDKTIQDLKQQHEQILKLLGDAKTLGIASKESKQLLLKGKHLILQHLKHEDDHVYPVLMSNKETQYLATIFSEDMKGLARTAIEFFAKMEAGTEDDMVLAKELGRLIANLKLRISKEEGVLYNRFIEVTQGKMSQAG